MTAKSSKAIHRLVIQNLPRDFVLAILEGLEGAAAAAFNSVTVSHPGHLAHELGNARHFRANEVFFDVLLAYGASPSPLKGNDLVVGQTGDLKLGRFNVRAGPWYNARRSRKRVELTQANEYLAELVQPSLFERGQKAATGIVFFVTEFGESPDPRPRDILVAVPAPGMTSWLYCESITTFLQGYNEPSRQDDFAKPVLRASVKKGKDNEGGTT